MLGCSIEISSARILRKIRKHLGISTAFSTFLVLIYSSFWKYIPLTSSLGRHYSLGIHLLSFSTILQYVACTYCASSKWIGSLLMVKKVGERMQTLALKRNGDRTVTCSKAFPSCCNAMCERVWFPEHKFWWFWSATSACILRHINISAIIFSVFFYWSSSVIWLPTKLMNFFHIRDILLK